MAKDAKLRKFVPELENQVSFKQWMDSTCKFPSRNNSMSIVDEKEDSKPEPIKELETFHNANGNFLKSNENSNPTSIPRTRISSNGSESFRRFLRSNRESFKSLLVEDRVLSDGSRSSDRFLRAILRGFLIGSGIKGGLSAFSILSRIWKKNPKGSIVRGRSVLQHLLEAFRYGGFFGCFAGTYTIVDGLISYIGGKKTARWRSLVAGAIAGPSLLLTGSQVPHRSLSIYIFIRALVLIIRCGIKSQIQSIKNFFSPFACSYGDALLMCLSASQILYSWILEPHSLPSSYISFLNLHGGKHPLLIHGVRELAEGNKLSLSSSLSIQSYWRNNGHPSFCIDENMSIPCKVLHPNLTCRFHFLDFLWRAYFRALPVYIPVYVVPALLVHRKSMLDRPLTLLGKSAIGIARSSLFLSSFCACAWLSTCTFHQLFQLCNGSIIAMASFPAGLAVLIEKKSRRMELALYSFSRAIESFGLCADKWGWFGPIQPFMSKRTDVILFSFATAVIMHCYACERDVFKSKYLNVLDWVFGIPVKTEPVTNEAATDIPVKQEPVLNEPVLVEFEENEPVKQEPMLNEPVKKETATRGYLAGVRKGSRGKERCVLNEPDCLVWTSSNVSETESFTSGPDRVASLKPKPIAQVWKSEPNPDSVPVSNVNCLWMDEGSGNRMPDSKPDPQPNLEFEFRELAVTSKPESKIQNEPCIKDSQNCSQDFEKEKENDRRNVDSIVEKSGIYFHDDEEEDNMEDMDKLVSIDYQVIDAKVLQSQASDASSCGSC